MFIQVEMEFYSASLRVSIDPPFEFLPDQSLQVAEELYRKDESRPVLVSLTVSFRPACVTPPGHN
jgi:hypothetical protein